LKVGVVREAGPGRVGEVEDERGGGVGVAAEEGRLLGEVLGDQGGDVGYGGEGNVALGGGESGVFSLLDH
jgi:hypothetical protein